jgi:uncharacterized protein (DUF1684 family)
VSEVDEFRAEKDAFFRDDPRSPLTPDQRTNFRGLSYYPEDGRLRIDGVLDTEVDRTEEIAMATSTGGTQAYHRAGKIRFEVEGQTADITLYGSSDMPELFVPFRDATSGTETYGAGRYLEVEPPEPGGRVLVDFNLAYNPYCCYNESWSCPIPPRENWLAVPVRAGERDFDGEVARPPTERGW